MLPTLSKTASLAALCLSGFLASARCSSQAAILDSDATPSASGEGCAGLKQLYPDQTFFPGDVAYEYEAQAFWSNTELMNPGCVFRPTSADEVSSAVMSSRRSKTEFAVRGGGHMGIKGSNNIDNGILMVLSNLTTLELDDDKSVLTLGPGYKWSDVYSYLEAFDLAVAGGRLSPVGVPGLLLAGGINFHGNQHGWAADNVLEYEVVLADGRIVTASADDNTDLFWALKGGSSNFGIVTRFKLRTFPSTRVWAGTYTVSAEYLDDFFAALANFTLSNTDPRSHVVPMTVATAENASVAAVILFYDSDTVSEPECFAEILKIPAVANTCAFKTLSAFAVETGGLVVDHINDMFIAGTTVGKDFDSLLRGMKITNDVFYSALPELFAQVPFKNFSMISMDWQPITTLWQQGSQAANPIGNPLGVDPASKGAYLAWAEVVEWFSSEDDEVIIAWVEKTTKAVSDATRAAGIFDAFNYMGDASGFQEIYAGYGAENQARLLDISRKYDPERVFQTLLPGGFKIGM